jgi:alpha,alpha-trehalase
VRRQCASAAGLLGRDRDVKGRVPQALLIPLVGFLPPDDERVRSTVLAIADELR